MTDTLTSDLQCREQLPGFPVSISMRLAFLFTLRRAAGIDPEILKEISLFDLDDDEPASSSNHG